MFQQFSPERRSLHELLCAEFSAAVHNRCDYLREEVQRYRQQQRRALSHVDSATPPPSQEPIFREAGLLFYYLHDWRFLGITPATVPVLPADYGALWEAIVAWQKGCEEAFIKGKADPRPALRPPVLEAALQIAAREP